MKRAMIFNRKTGGLTDEGRMGQSEQGVAHAFLGLLTGALYWCGIDMFFMVREERAGVAARKCCFDIRKEFRIGRASQTYLSTSHQLLSPALL